MSLALWVYCTKLQRYLVHNISCMLCDITHRVLFLILYIYITISIVYICQKPVIWFWPTFKFFFLLYLCHLSRPFHALFSKNNKRKTCHALYSRIGSGATENQRITAHTEPNCNDAKYSSSENENKSPISTYLIDRSCM